jgi:hypothetical protein
MKIEIVGGPADGQQIERPRAATVIVPVEIPGKAGFGGFKYTLRRCRNADGSIIEVLAPAGRTIDPSWLAVRKLKN